MWWSHIGWMMVQTPGLKKVGDYTIDMQKDPYYRWLHRYYVWLQLPLGILLYTLGGWSFVLWGIPLRLAIVYHATWTVNSVTHTWGTQPFDTEDKSSNNKWVAAFTFGEGWHNNHHKFPSSAKQGILPGQIDLTCYHILLLKKLGLARDVKVQRLG